MKEYSETAHICGCYKLNSSSARSTALIFECQSIHPAKSWFKAGLKKACSLRKKEVEILDNETNRKNK